MREPARPRKALYTCNRLCFDDPTRFWPHDEAHPVYIIIDLKSFYASVECVIRGLDPMTARLVVADPSRGEGTICLAVSPALKALGVKNRCRIYEIPASLDYITAPPQMKLYEQCSAEIYGVYLQYFSREDIHVYSCDEAFMDITHYLDLYHMSPKELGVEVMNAVSDRTGIRSTCGIGTNLFLAKIALDIVSKHSPDFIGILDEDTYRSTLWDHRPITDFWMIARGTQRRLASMGIFTMHDIARAAMNDDRGIYKAFGVNAEILIDHAFGIEKVGMYDIKHYESDSRSLSLGQTLLRDYSFSEASVIIREMMDQLCLQMAAKGVVTESVTFFIVYSHDWTDSSGIPAWPSHATIRASQATDSDEVWRPLIAAEYNRIARRDAPVRRLGICCNRIADRDSRCFQYSLFDESGSVLSDPAAGAERQARNHRLRRTVLSIKERYGKNAVLKGINLLEAGTMKERNLQIGGHRAGDT